MLPACSRGSVCGEPDCPICQMNKEQKETFEMLLSQIDNLEVQWDYMLTEKGVENTKTIVFSGDGQDGPSVGYIEIDGKVSWLCAG